MDARDLDMLGMNLAEVGTEPTNIVKNCNDKSSVSDDYSYKSAEVGTDCISRQAAIDAVSEGCEECRGVFERCEKNLLALPSAQPELSDEEKRLIKQLRSYHNGSYAKVIDKLIASAQPKRGRWVLDRSGAYCCSECMEPCAGYVMMKPRDKFCKMCGAKMEGADDE